jgi:serine/threonine protein kinase
VYTIGLLLYEMLSGRLPFYADNESSLAMQHLNQAPAPLQTLVPQVSPRLARIVDKILAKEPAARYRDAGQVAQIIDWLMIALIIAALIAVLGLIPVWRIVYRRYAADNLPYGQGASTVPSSASMPFLCPLPEEETFLGPSHIEDQGSQATERTEVSGFTFSGMGVRFKATFRRRPSPSGTPVLQPAYLWVGRSCAFSVPRGRARCPGAEPQIERREFPEFGSLAYGFGDTLE